MPRKPAPRRERVAGGPAAGMSVEGTAKRRDSPQEAWGHGAAAIELHRVGRIRQWLQK
ncbi:hypothetical protein R9X49_15220 [Pectobacterium carotovorum]|uniref:hypothetical protein n=1 Tax=Pectobacterium carotovorum TaxID=554 RepID=UPI0029D50C58|nr:hypothetical protein [Pectobacterium carotovorum]MDX6916458.1 hypothetical protein [Pectobacterium carotovorum]